MMRPLVLVVVAATFGCEERVTTISPQYFRADEAGGLGERCGDGFNRCQSGLTCYDGACTPDDIVDACEAAPSCGDGLCIARGEALDVFCNCPTAQVWNGNTCVTDDTPSQEGDVLFATLTGTLDGADFESEVRNPGADGRCALEYASDGTGNGLVLRFSGAVTRPLDSPELVIDVDDVDATREGSFVVWPEVYGEPASDAGRVAISLGADDFFGAAGGRFSIDSISGSDLVGDDGILDTDVRVGGSFYLGISSSDFIAGAFTVACGDPIIGAP